MTAFRPISEAARSWSCDNSCCCLNLTTYSLPNLNLTTVVITSHYSRSKAHGPNIPASEEGDVEPDCVAPVAATHPVSDIPATTPVRSSVAAAGQPGSMATESAGPVSVPSSSPEGKPSSGGGPGTSGPVGSPQMGVFLGYPSGLQVRLKLTPKLEDGCSHCHRRNWITTHAPPTTTHGYSSSLRQWRRRDSSRRRRCCRRRTVACRTAVALTASARDGSISHILRRPTNQQCS